MLCMHTPGVTFQPALLLNKAGQWVRKVRNVPPGPGCPSSPRLCSRDCNRRGYLGGLAPFIAPSSSTPLSHPVVRWSISVMHLHPWICLIAFLNLQIQRLQPLVAASSPPAPVQWFVFFFLSALLWPPLALHSLKFWWVFGCHTAHQWWFGASQWVYGLQWAGCAWEHSWVPQPPVPLFVVPWIRATWSWSHINNHFIYSTLYLLLPSYFTYFPLLLLPLYSMLPFYFQLLRLLQLIHCSVTDVGSSQTASAVKTATKKSLSFSATTSSFLSDPFIPLSSAFPLIS